MVPTEQVVETKGGEKVQVEKRIFPGYVLVKMTLTDDSWSLVKNTPGVTGFVGSENKPTALSPAEVDRILHTSTAEKPKAKAEFSVGDQVKVSSGPLAEFTGEVAEVNVGAEQAQSHGVHLRAGHAYRTGLRTGQADLTHARIQAKDTERDRWQRRFARVSSFRSCGSGQPGAARRSRPGSARRQHHGVLQGVQRPDAGQDRHHRPGGDHGLRGQVVHVHPQDSPGGGPYPPGRRHAQGLRRAESRQGGRASRANNCGRSPRSRCPTSTPTTSRRP